MPAKRKTTAKKPATSTKKPKTDLDTVVQDSIERLKAADTGKKTHPVDVYVNNPNDYSVHEDYDCMLNQTNIGNNNNKFYVIQLLRHQNGDFATWNRWGRVGEDGMDKMSQWPSLEMAIKDFEKKFRDKTKNAWSARDKFVPHEGKYHLIDMGDETDSPEESDRPLCLRQSSVVCKLDPATKDLIKLIFDYDMFRDAMVNLSIDYKKMPLGKLSKGQIAKGFECLEEIQKVLNKTKKGNLSELSSKFYTVIPHDFGRSTPQTISDMATLQAKLDMLSVLADIELAQTIEKEGSNSKEMKKDEEHPLDICYRMLKCRLSPITPNDPHYKVIETYIKNTLCGTMMPELCHIWEVDRQYEGDSFKSHDEIDHRKLLWHGTNIAVVVAILRSGLRIMPHSGGRVGKGIYFASEYSKSAGYMRTAQDGVGMMFLNEVALGNEYSLTAGDGSLTKAPTGYDSIVARGATEPDPKQDKKIQLGGHSVIVPQGRPKPTMYRQSSSFSQSEYLIYKESQCRIRFMIQIKI